MNRENWIKIEQKVFTTGDSLDINQLLGILIWKPKDSLSRYNFFVNIPPAKLINVENYKSLPPIAKSKILEQYKAAFNAGKNKNYKYLVDEKESYIGGEYSVEQAIRFFNTRVSILVENGRNDAHFLKTIFKFFDKSVSEKKRLLNFCKNDWIHFDNAGGWTNIDNVVEGLKNSLEDFCTEQGRDVKDFIRCFVLMDSDKQFPNDIPEKKIELKDKLEELGIEVHILNKRAMENYMPDEVINDEATKNINVKNWNKAYQHLNAEQKDFLNFQKGFPKENKLIKPRHLQEDEIKNLYSNPPISDSNYNILDKGMQYPNFKEEFPKKFNSPFCFMESLLIREGGTYESNEFNEIINKINKLL